MSFIMATLFFLDVLKNFIDGISGGGLPSRRDSKEVYWE